MVRRVDAAAAGPAGLCRPFPEWSEVFDGHPFQAGPDGTLEVNAGEPREIEAHDRHSLSPGAPKRAGG